MTLGLLMRQVRVKLTNGDKKMKQPNDQGRLEKWLEKNGVTYSVVANCSGLNQNKTTTFTIKESSYTVYSSNDEVWQARFSNEFGSFNVTNGTVTITRLIRALNQLTK